MFAALSSRALTAIRDDCRSTTSAATRSPTPAPTAHPSRDPTADPTADPTPSPTHSPTANPTPSPSAHPTAPTLNPTSAPTHSHYFTVPGRNNVSTEWVCTDAEASSENITVSCCAMDGSDCERSDCTSQVNYADAAALCASNGRRLCTADELGLGCQGACQGSGCLFDLQTA